MKKHLGTSAVYFTAISTILGAVMFLRFGYAVANVGFLGTLGIILMGHVITIATALAIAETADEIDMVMNVGSFLDEDYEEVITEIEEVKNSCRGNLLKVIIETGALKEPETIAKASLIALYSGADFIKTSTGKFYPGASLEAVYIMCLMIKKYYENHGKKIGIKVAGGITSIEEALGFYKIVEAVLGKEWLDTSGFRIGTSRLFESIIEAIEA